MEASGGDGFAVEIGVSYVEALREDIAFTIGISSQSGIHWPEESVFRRQNPSTCSTMAIRPKQRSSSLTYVTGSALTVL